jgi:CRP-like cAMP-binding protein
MARMASAKRLDRLPPTNRLLDALPREPCLRLLEACTPVELTRGQSLYEPGTPLRFVYFPTSSYVCWMIPVDPPGVLEVGLVGNEGMVGLPLLLGVDRSPLRARVQGAGHAWRLGADAFLQACSSNVAWCALLRRYLQACIWQLAQTAGCTRFHVVEQRLARWLLMTQDRAHQGQFHVTHESLASLLGVRRVGVTKAATALQQRGLIRYHRGDVTVLDRVGLMSASCGCYRIDCERADLLRPATRTGKVRRLAPGS